MKEIEYFIIEVLKNHPYTESVLTEKVSAIYPISVCFYPDGNFASVEIRISLSRLLDSGKVLISDTHEIVIKDNQSF